MRSTTDTRRLALNLFITAVRTVLMLIALAMVVITLPAYVIAQMISCWETVRTGVPWQKTAHHAGGILDPGKERARK